MARLALVGALAGCVGCAVLVSDTPPPAPSGASSASASPTVTFKGPISSGPIALSADDKVLVAVNPDRDTISVFDSSTDALTKLREVVVGAEPRSVAVAPDGKRAYVANAASGTVSVVDLTQGTIVTTISVGAEPVALALAPAGTRLFVASSVAGSIAVVNTGSNSVITTVAIPSSSGIQPRALAITNDGDADDLDEKVYIPLFFAQLRPGKTGLDEGNDDHREGRVVVLQTSTNGLSGTIVLGPMADTGFKSNGSVLDLVSTTNGAGGTNAADPANPAPSPANFVTGAFPNQLAGVAIHPTLKRAYVVSTGASPNGPFGFDVNMQGLVSVIDTVTDIEVTSSGVSSSVFQKAPLNLNQGIGNTTNVPKLFLSSPVAIAFRPSGTEAWIVVQTSDLIVRMRTDSGGIPTVDAPQVKDAGAVVRVDTLKPGGSFLAGKAPRGIVINSTGTRGYVYNFVSRSVTAVNLDLQAVAGTAQSSPLPATGTPEATVGLGAELFFTGRGPDGRMSSEAWGACIACHPDGRTDNVTWVFPAGPRQTSPLDAAFNRRNTADQRIFNWSALRDEVQDFELNTRNVSGGRGLIEDDRPLFVIGGLTDAGADSALVEEYHQFLDTVATTSTIAGGGALPVLTSVASARRDFGVATLADGRVYIIGGRTGVGAGALVAAASAVLEYDPATNVLRTRSSTGFTNRHSLGAAAVDTTQGPRVYAIGGYTAITGDPPTDLPVGTTQEYNPSTDTWRTVAPLPGGAVRAEFGIAASAGVNSTNNNRTGRVYVVGGNVASIAGPLTNESVFELEPNLTTSNVTWTDLTVAAGLTITSRRRLGAAVAIRLVTPRLFAIGGINDLGTTLALVEDLNIVTRVRTTTTITNLPVGRHSFGIGVSSNRIYIAGGRDATGTGNVTLSVAEFNPAINGPVAGVAGVPSGQWTEKRALSGRRESLGMSSAPIIANYTPSPSSFRDDRQDAIAEWIKRAIRSHVAPNRGSTALSVSRGRTLFATTGLTGVTGVSCATCHGGPKWTRSTVSFAPPPSTDTIFGGREKIEDAELTTTSAQPKDTTGVLVDVGTFLNTRNQEKRFNPADVSNRIDALGAKGFNIPSLLSVFATPPYFHTGLAETLEQVLNGTLDGQGAGSLRTIHFVTSATDRADLIEFLRSIDETTTTFP